MNFERFFETGGEAFCDRVQKLIDSRPAVRLSPRRERRLVLTSFEAIALPGWQEAGLTFVAIGAWLGVTSEQTSDLARRA